VCSSPRQRQQQQQQQEQEQEERPPAFRFAFERQLAAGGPAPGKLPAAREIDDAIARQPPPPAALPAGYAFGDVGRLLRRYAAQGGGEGLDLSHALAGPSQVRARARVVVCVCACVHERVGAFAWVGTGERCCQLHAH
jgi:hypothetical protein